MFPDASPAVIRQDLAHSGSVHVTIDNILEGRIPAVRKRLSASPQCCATMPFVNNHASGCSINERLPYRRLQSLRPLKQLRQCRALSRRLPLR